MTKSNRYVVHLGGAFLLLETPAGGHWSTGIMAGYGHHQIDQHTERYFQPFTEVNWIHNSQRHGVKMDGTKVELAGAENRAEMKLGLEANLSQQGSIWVNTAVQVGSCGYNDNRLTLGGKWHF